MLQEICGNTKENDLKKWLILFVWWVGFAYKVVGRTTIWLPMIALKIGLQIAMLNTIKDLNVYSSSRLVLRWSGIAFGLTNDMRAKVWSLSCGSIIMRGECWGNHNSAPYDRSKNIPLGCDIECHKKFECIFLITNWFWGGVALPTVRQRWSKLLEYTDMEALT